MFTLLSNNDIHRSMRAEAYDNLIAGLTTVELDRAEATAIEATKSKLRGRYNFNEMVTTKSPLLIEWVVTIYLYHLHRRQNPRLVPDDIATGYDQCIQWLNDVRDGKEHPDLPLIIDENGDPDIGTNDLRSGSQTSQMEDNSFY